MDWAAELNRLRGKAEATTTNAQRREVYHQAEGLYQEIRDKVKDENEAKPFLDTIDDIEKKYLCLEPAQLPKTAFHRVIQQFDMLVRITTCSVYLCLLGMLTFLPLVVIAPMIDRFLLSVGWPKRLLVYEFCRKASAHGFLILAGVFFRVEGWSPHYATPVLLLFQHGSNLDGFLILRVFPQFFKSIGKDDIFLMPYVGWMAFVYGILPIDRKHRDNAIKQLGRATYNCKRGVPLALSPEGTRSKTGQLMRFKKGPFYVQEEAKADVVPLVITGNYELWPPNRLFTCTGQVIMKFLPVIKANTIPFQGAGSKDAWSRLVREQMFTAIDDITSKPDQYEPAAALTWPQRLLNLAAIAVFWVMVSQLWRVVGVIRAALGLTPVHMWMAFVAYSAGITASLHFLYCKQS